VIFYQNGPSVSFDEKGIASIVGTESSKNAYYMEAEINSPIVTLQPGESYAFDTAWHPIAIDAQPKEFSAAGLVVEGLKARFDAENLHLKGNFSVFVPGKLVAVFFNRNGAIIGQHELQNVDPAKIVALDSSLPADQGVVRVSLKLIDSNGEDRGSLSVAKVEAP
jgi:hypothetical protein